MPTQENKSFIRRYAEALNQDKSLATLAEYVADEELMGHIAFFEAAFPGYQITAEDLIAEGDQVVLRGSMHGQHKGDLMGIPPTGKNVNVSLIITYRIADEKIVQHWMVADQMSLMQQLGVA
ncbi:MAG: ester cyclase [Chloroflexi bacterium]|nr:ester cyclase [Chloroflexota bacterium]